MIGNVIRYSYWLGLVAIALSLILRLLNHFSIYISTYVQGTGISPRSLAEVSAFLLLLSIATAHYQETSGTKS